MALHSRSLPNVGVLSSRLFWMRLASLHAAIPLVAITQQALDAVHTRVLQTHVNDRSNSFGVEKVSKHSYLAKNLETLRKYQL